MKIKWDTIKKNCLLLLTVFCSVALFAQQKPHYTQYILNNYILNPALSGIENYTDVKFSHRHQWVGFEDAPVTTYFSIQGPIRKPDYKTTATTLFDVPGDNPRGKEYWDEYQPSPSHHGIGMQFISDRSGPFTNTSFQVTYAYHMGINAKTNLSAGIGLGASKLSVNSNKLFFGNDFPVDPSVYSSGEIGKTKMDLNAGLWLYSANYFVGLSAQQLLPQKLDFSENTVTVAPEKGKLVPHFFATAGYRFLLSEDINVLPSVMAKMVSPVPLQFDLNIKAQYRDQFWIGGSYRGKYGFAALAGFNALNFFTVSYSYDYSTTRIHTVSSGTHEILLGIILGNKYSQDTCPKNVW